MGHYYLPLVLGPEVGAALWGRWTASRGPENHLHTVVELQSL